MPDIWRVFDNYSILDSIAAKGYNKLAWVSNNAIYVFKGAKK